MSYFSVVHADAPVHWWRCADPGGLLLNDIGSGPAVPLTTERSGGLPYTGPSSDGGSLLCVQGLNVGNNRGFLPVPASNISLEGWVFPIDVSSVGTIVMEMQNGGINRPVNGPAFIDLLLTQDGNAQFNFTGFAGNPGAHSPTLVTYAQWHHIVGTYDGANMRIYVDGALKATTATVAAANAQYGVFAGQTSPGHIDSGCGLAELAYYTTVLSAAQVLAHFNAADTSSGFPVYQGGGAYVQSIAAGGGMTTQQSLANLFSTYLNSP